MKGSFIACATLTKTATKQAVRFCDEVNVISVQPTDSADSVLATIAVADVKIGGNETNASARRAALGKGVDALTVLKTMRKKAKDQQDDAASRRLAGEGGAKGKADKGKAGATKGGTKKKMVPKKAGDKRKKGQPLNQSRIMCDLRCAGDCETRGLRKTTCVCGEGQFGKWCNTDNKLRTKKSE